MKFHEFISSLNPEYANRSMWLRFIEGIIIRDHLIKRKKYLLQHDTGCIESALQHAIDWERLNKLLFHEDNNLNANIQCKCYC